MSDNKAKVADIRNLAEDEGVLDPAAIKLPTSRWPRWAQVRYSGTDEPASSPTKAVDPFRVEDDL